VHRSVLERKRLAAAEDERGNNEIGNNIMKAKQTPTYGTQGSPTANKTMTESFENN